MEMTYRDELYHHGILGQKWGVRRYQNEDGTLTAAGKKRYLNADGTLNYKGLQKQRKDTIDKDPYGKLKKEGGSGRTAEQSNRYTKDRLLYGDKGVARIKDKINTGMTYSQAVKSEKLRLGARYASIVLAYAVTMDFALNGGQTTKAVASKAVKTGAYAVKKLKNNLAGIAVSDLGIGRAAFDQNMMDIVFG